VDWHIAMRPGKRAALDLSSPLAAKIEPVEKIKASIRAKVGYRGLAKNTARLQVMFALGNLWTVRKTLLQRAQG
jgi:IS5 family transposase